MRLDIPMVRRLIRLALDEDLLLGDPTTELSFSENVWRKAEFLAKENLVVCGLPLAALIFEEYGVPLKVARSQAEGTKANRGDCILSVEAGLKDLLTLERTLLNFLQRMCGVASYTAEFVSKAQGITVLDTRKTTPGWRVLEKYATRTGGATNHRMALGDMLMVKNNHVDNHTALGGMAGYLRSLIERKPANLGVEVETRTMQELIVALDAGADYVMLDNWELSKLSEAFKLVAACALPPMVEISGGVTIDAIPGLEAAKVKLISVGALTRRATMVDISMRIS